MKPQVQVFNVCDYCQGKAYLPYEGGTNAKGKSVIRHSACPQCHGTGRSNQWITIEEFILMMGGSLKDADRELNEQYGSEEPVTSYQDSRESAGLW